MRRLSVFVVASVTVLYAAVLSTRPVSADELDRCYNYQDSHNAISACTWLIRRGEYHPMADVYNARGVAYRWIRSYDQAIADFNQAIYLNPRHSIAFGQRGIAYLNKGDVGQARADLQTAVALDPNNQTAVNELSMLQRR